MQTNGYPVGKRNRILDFLKKDSSGVAILLALGMLGILFVLAVGFVFTTETDLKMADVNIRSAQCKELAESGLSAAIAMIRYVSDTANETATGGDTIFQELAIGNPMPSVSGCMTNLDSRRVLFSYSPDYASEPISTDDLYRIATNFTLNSSLTRISFFDWQNNDWLDTSVYDYKSSTAKTNFKSQVLNKFSWVNVKVDGAIVGRYAFVIIDESNKINPFYFQTDTERYGVSLKEADWAAFKSSLTSEKASATGELAYEIFADTIFVDTVVAEVQQWYDVRHILTGIANKYPSISNSNLRCISKYLYSQIGLGEYKTQEAYIGNGKKYNRFNLARGDWNSLSVNDILCEPTIYTNSDTDGYGIRWLYDWKSSAEKGTFDTVEHRVQQIAANLIDYCDSDTYPDSYPTTDQPNYPPTADPAYVGLERGAKLSEADVKFNMTISKTSNGLAAPNTKYCYTYSDVRITVSAEAFFLGLTSMSTPYIKVKPAFAMTATSTMGLYENSAATLPIEGTGAVVQMPGNDVPITLIDEELDISSGLIDYAVGDDVALFSASPAYAVSDWVDTSYNIDDLEFRMTIATFKAYLKSSDVHERLIDFADIAKNKEIRIKRTVSGNYYAAWETDDPRQNHNSLDWTLLGPDADVNIGSLGKLNKSFAPASAAADDDGLVNYSSIPPGQLVGDNNLYGFGFSPSVGCSTRFIRNATIKSPWELGAIHRAEKWQTINLKAFNDSGFAYGQGDGKILDQIKMDASAYNSKINVNTHLKPLLYGLLAKISYPPSGNYDYTDSIVGDDLLTATTLGNMVDGIMAANGSTGGSQFTNRGAIASVPVLQNATITSQTDMERECVIGKIANLLNVEPQPSSWGKYDIGSKTRFTVVVLAQTINDIGPSSGEMDINVDINKDGIISKGSGAIPYVNERDDSLYGCTMDFDGDGLDSSRYITENLKAQRGRYDQFVDKITGTYKIYAEIERDPKLDTFRVVRLIQPDETSAIEY